MTGAASPVRPMGAKRMGAPKPTPADHERLRLAAQKRARKAERLRRTLSHG